MAIIQLHHVFYSLDDRTLLNDIDFSINAADKLAIVGRNGVGKTTLLRLIVGELLPTEGNVERRKMVHYCSQNYAAYQQFSVARALGITNKLAALQRIEAGNDDAQDYTTLADDWLVHQRYALALAELGLLDVDFQKPLQDFSGGEQTKIFLCRAFMSDADLLLLDEPSNNLDAQSKQLLYKNIQQWGKALVVVSHNRELLNQMTALIELDSLGMKLYGGNFDFYRQQKTIEQAALQQQADDAKQIQRKTARSIQYAREMHEQKVAKGKQMRRDRVLDTVTLDGMKGRSEKTQHRMRLQNSMRTERTQEQLDEATAKLEVVDKIKVVMPNTHVPARKMMLSLNDVSFAYEQKDVLKNITLLMQGPQRLAITGCNGAGKTTLVNIILGRLKAQGEVELGTDRSALAQFLFRNRAADKLVSVLSGGEKLRAGLACVLLSKHAPQLLILDEPTNHLDLDSILALEQVLNCYEGALIMISHDKLFLENINIDQAYVL